MPNHTANLVKIIGEQERVQEFLDKVKTTPDDNPELEEDFLFDMNNVIPKPKILEHSFSGASHYVVRTAEDSKWIKDTLRAIYVQAKDGELDLERLFEAAAEYAHKVNDGNTKEYVIDRLQKKREEHPLVIDRLSCFWDWFAKEFLGRAETFIRAGATDHLLVTPGDFMCPRPFTPEEKKELDAVGHMNWYSWSIENWGTKWNAYDCELRQKPEPSVDHPGMYEAHLYYETAWSPPRPVMDELAMEFIDLSLDHGYIDEGWCYAGRSYYVRGSETVTDIECDSGNEEFQKHYLDVRGFELETYDEDEEV